MKKTSMGLYQDYDFDGDSYSISIHWYDDVHENYTAKWRRRSDGKTGELGFGVPQSQDAYDVAEKAIREERLKEKVTA